MLDDAVNWFFAIGGISGLALILWLAMTETNWRKRR